MNLSKRIFAAVFSLALAGSQFTAVNMQSDCISANAAEQVLAFPGAVGVGKYATGGRGGEVYHVTNLNDSGEGSFRDAVSKSNRIVVFDVSGTIELKGNIICQGNITIAGQTAPGGSGITLKNYKMGMGGDNIICRFIGSRPGPYASTSSGNDAWGGAKGSNSIIDHCSMGWTTDEQWGLYSANKYTTVQYSVIGPADSWGGHDKGVHGFGIMMPGTSTFDHNLIIHNVSRNFRGKIGGTETCDFTNNVIYNWAYQTAYGTIGHLNYVNNTLKMGKGTVSGKHYVNVDSSTNPQNFSIYCSGNRMLNKDNTVYAEVTNDNWNGIKVKDGLGITKDSIKSNTPFPTYGSKENLSTVTNCESAEKSYKNVLSFAGNGISSEQRTDIDKQCAEECRTGTGTLSGTAAYADASSSDKEKIDKYSIACGVEYTYPKAVLQKTIVDKDNDGMADDWELARGLNPNDSSDTSGDYCGQGYTNIEYYINDLTVNAFPEGVVTLSPENVQNTEPVSGKFISKLNVDDKTNAKAWSIGENLANGSLIYGDRDFTYIDVPAQLTGAEYILTACDSKFYENNLASFTALDDITVYVAFDNRVEILPAWISDWKATDLTITSSNDVVFDIYSKDFSKDEKIILGTNGQSSYCVNYTVMAVEKSEITVVSGDVNKDGTFSIADAVSLQNYLLGKTDAVLADWKAADLYTDNKLDVYDFISMREMLV